MSGGQTDPSYRDPRLDSPAATPEEFYDEGPSSNNVIWGSIALVLLFVIGSFYLDKPAPAQPFSLGECTVVETQGVTLLKDCTKVGAPYMYKKR
jgi:hypothetical protein